MIRLSYAQAVKLQARAQERKERRDDNRRFIAKINGKKLEPSRSWLRDQLDALWSLTIRSRAVRDQHGLCAICGRGFSAERPIVAYHLWPRSNDAIRWHLDAGIGACSPCNNGERLHRLEYREKHRMLFGDKFAALEALAKTKADFSRADLIAKRDEFKRILQTRSY